MGIQQWYEEWSRANIGFLVHPADPNRDPTVFINKYTPTLPVVTVIVYLIVVFTLPKLLKAFKIPPITLRWAGALWNLGLSIFSLACVFGAGMFYLDLLTNYPLYDVYCGNGQGWNYVLHNPHPVLFWSFLFAWSKYAELFDTLFLILRQKPIAFLHWYHHATVLLYVWFAEYSHLCTGYIFILVNAFVHTIMYFYYFLSEIGHKPSEKVALLITILQISQMIIGVSILVAYIYFWITTGTPCHCSHPGIMLAAGIVMYGSYLFLFVQFFVRRYFGKKPAPRAVTGKSTTGKPQTKKTQ